MPQSLLCPEALVRICGGHREFARSLLDKFKLSAPFQVGEIRDAFNRQDPRGLHDAAHGLKGAAAIMGATSISHVASQIETAAKANNLDSIEPTIDRLQDLVRRSLDVTL